MRRSRTSSFRFPRATHGTTLPELLVATLVLLLLCTVIATYLHRLSLSLGRGEDDLTIGREIQYILRHLSLRFGSLGPPLLLDPNEDLLQVGEERGIRPLHRVTLLEEDGRRDNGAESLEYVRTSLEPVVRSVSGHLGRSSAEMVEQYDGRRTILSRRVADLHFRRGADPRLLLIDLTLTVRRPRGGSARPVRQTLALRPDCDRVVFEEKGDSF